MKLSHLIPLFAVAIAGCTHSVHQVSLSSADDIPRGARVRAVHSEAEQFVFFYVTDNTDFADEAYDELLKKCPKGRLVAIEARHSTSHGFLSFKNHMKMTGWCLENRPPPALAKSAPPEPAPVEPPSESPEPAPEPPPID